MGTVVHLNPKRSGKDRSSGTQRFVRCEHCGERHPVIRMSDGVVRCITAFADGEYRYAATAAAERDGWLNAGWANESPRALRPQGR